MHDWSPVRVLNFIKLISTYFSNNKFVVQHFERQNYEKFLITTEETTTKRERTEWKKKKTKRGDKHAISNWHFIYLTISLSRPTELDKAIHYDFDFRSFSSYFLNKWTWWLLSTLQNKNCTIPSFLISCINEFSFSFQLRKENISLNYHFQLFPVQFTC